MPENRSATSLLGADWLHAQDLHSDLTLLNPDVSSDYRFVSIREKVELRKRTWGYRGRRSILGRNSSHCDLGGPSERPWLSSKLARVAEHSGQVERGGGGWLGSVGGKHCSKVLLRLTLIWEQWCSFAVLCYFSKCLVFFCRTVAAPVCLNCDCCCDHGG